MLSSNITTDPLSSRSPCGLSKNRVLDLVLRTLETAQFIGISLLMVLSSLIRDYNGHFLKGFICNTSLENALFAELKGIVVRM